MAQTRDSGYTEPMTCPECLGTGSLECPTCEGEGTVESIGEVDLEREEPIGRSEYMRQSQGRDDG